ncbi:hypothetical protein [Xanthovirga aplysinae]|uniref:hypothetical protein n=1 Tax=Xanthovirga aplysinae TaxID=2529853 RepID=UPI0012BB5C67|nr:hypothetical protein [Xanthovirga aplysinae]MTI32413.1 hypothetical protein [Xanthovirga aplysinae]
MAKSSLPISENTRLPSIQEVDIKEVNYFFGEGLNTLLCFQEAADFKILESSNEIWNNYGKKNNFFPLTAFDQKVYVNGRHISRLRAKRSNTLIDFKNGGELWVQEEIFEVLQLKGVRNKK